MRFAILIGMLVFASSCAARPPVVYTMWKNTTEDLTAEETDPSVCEGWYAKVYPLKEGNHTTADIIRETAVRSGWVRNVPEVHEYIPEDKMPRNYLLVIYFCEYIGNGQEGKKMTVLLVPNGRYEYAIYHDNFDERWGTILNTWDFYQQAFEKVDNQNKLQSFFYSVAGNFASLSADSRRFKFMRHPPDDVPDRDDDTPPCNNDGVCDKDESPEWCRADCSCNFDGVCDNADGETFDNCEDDCPDSSPPPPPATNEATGDEPAEEEPAGEPQSPIAHLHR